MKHLIIRHFGPIKEVDIELGRINLIIGSQSSGKSTVLKTACYCSWVEKRIELMQKSNGFGNGSAFIDILTDYYNIASYIHDDTYFEYETEYLKFCYNHQLKSFTMCWKADRWEYKRPKVSYIPADRNLVASIPGWSSMSLDGNMIEFLSDWDKARRYLKKEENFLNLGLSYTYDSTSNTDRIQLENSRPIKLEESSSGIQSLLPMYVYLHYLTKGQYNDQNIQVSYEKREERKNLLSNIYSTMYNMTKQGNGATEIVSLEGLDYSFSEHEYATRFRKIYQNFLKVDHSEIFLEEPEDNLFPPTQCQLINWMIDQIQYHDDFIFIATHSPYILNQAIKLSPDGMSILFTHHMNEKNAFTVRQLNDYEIHEIYDNGVDMFFNFEMYI